MSSLHPIPPLQNPPCIRISQRTSKGWPATERQLKPHYLFRAKSRSTSAKQVRARQRPRYSHTKGAASPGDGGWEDDVAAEGSRCWRCARGVATRRAAPTQRPRTVCCVRETGGEQTHAAKPDMVSGRLSEGATPEECCECARGGGSDGA
ncbi:hypothetical protein FA95DRAFT_1046757 [Auriscalpium vulgare]|uniref:Uncharacterized protein n=1 Tax=Auriscalpium vulgare TaxID=40419 RepID=A0ACB8S9T0_9AGAM|nr:hypothetical protein FA95DRAFT_1046757 [Auriscalpium vulgare]